MATRTIAAVDARMHIIAFVTGDTPFPLLDLPREEPIELVWLAGVA